MRPVPRHLDVAAVDGCWKAGGHRQRVLVFKGSFFTVEPSLVPLFGVTVQLGMRKFNLFPFLNRDATKFSVGSIYKFSAPVQMEKIPE